jgi:Zn-dependent protease with chaperone function
MQATAPGVLAAEYFDGASARAHRVHLSIAADHLLLQGDSIALQIPLAHVQWPERTRHGKRVAHLRDGGSLQAEHAASWDAWLAAAGVRESHVVRAQQSWRATAASVVALLLLAVAGYLWGLPWAARAIVAFVPSSVDRSIGDAAWESIAPRWLAPSTLPPARQQALRDGFARLVERTYPAHARPEHELRFHGSTHGRLGANAFALPGGRIVITDELVRLLEGRDDVVLGVLAHELGHVHHRHGMRSLVQVTLLGTATSLAFGDFSNVLAAAPVLFGQLGYSRDFEREADEHAVRMLRACELSPELMVTLFERLASARPGKGDGGARGGIGIAFASHPADAERIRLFRDAARR